MEKKYEINLSISRISPFGLRILSLRRCTAACTVNLGSQGGQGVVGWEDGQSWGVDNVSEVKACCMLCVSGFVGVFWGWGVVWCCMQSLHSLLHGYR